MAPSKSWLLISVNKGAQEKNDWDDWSKGRLEAGTIAGRDDCSKGRSEEGTIGGRDDWRKGRSEEGTIGGRHDQLKGQLMKGNTDKKNI